MQRWSMTLMIAMGDIAFSAFRFNDDESYRMCSECGGDCQPEPSGADGLGVRIMWVCPQHGVHSVVDPFEHLRERDRREREQE